MPTTDFTHLHLHTQYSFLDGAIRMPDLVSKVSELGMKQVAVTDHGNMFGALDFYQRAKKAGVKPIMGIEAYVTGVAGDVLHTDRVRENFHMVLLAENNTGYENLRRLSSTSFEHGKYYYPRMDKKLLRKHSEGIIALTACLGGEVGKKIAKKDHDGARDAVRELKDSAKGLRRSDLAQARDRLVLHSQWSRNVRPTKDRFLRGFCQHL